MRLKISGTAALLSALSALLLSLLAAVGTAYAAPVTIANGTQFTAPDGSPVHAHGGGVVKVGEYYYWFGENRNADNTFRYVSAYRSTDLKTWEFRNHVLTEASDPELDWANIERPKVVYNNATGQFVMWMHKENGSDYGEARAAVAVSSTVDGDYTWRGSFRPLGHMSRDITTFVDTDGTGYMISAANENADLHVYRLTADYTGIESQVQKLWSGQWREAPAMFKRNGVYFLLTSGATGWSPNQQKYATASSITGSWTDLKDVGDSTTYRSQTAYVLPVQGTKGTSFLYMGDRWGNSMGGMVNDSQYVWLPLTFPTNTSMTMEYSPQLTIDTAAGTVTGMSGPWETLSARHSGKCADVANFDSADGAALIQWGCGGGVNQHFWIKKLGTGYVQIMARNSGKCLDIAGSSTADGASAVQNTCNGSTSQQWKVRTTDVAGYVELVARHSGKCLDVVNWSTGDGTALDQWTCNSGDNQKWRRAAA
ncbi:RICIN domain-containing protein [Streptomyces sp. NBC_00094]|uniref:RICIN domain-containing protein n=1 Tax=Streptomyces sp. NBC_00094 TaxID=2903620 RepID=UPI00224CED70|nr:RICIN domain-containing protein [Streptomyces sp. NBC_00094]MCX5394431.1 RICIN domain-containing protein [Streptomyces sp. NBC_00094]